MGKHSKKKAQAIINSIYSPSKPPSISSSSDDIIISSPSEIHWGPPLLIEHSIKGESGSSRGGSSSSDSGSSSAHTIEKAPTYLEMISSSIQSAAIRSGKEYHEMMMDKMKNREFQNHFMDTMVQNFVGRMSNQQLEKFYHSIETTQWTDIMSCEPTPSSHSIITRIMSTFPAPRTEEYNSAITHMGKTYDGSYISFLDLESVNGIEKESKERDKLEEEKSINIKQLGKYYVEGDFHRNKLFLPYYDVITLLSREVIMERGSQSLESFVRNILFRVRGFSTISKLENILYHELRGVFNTFHFTLRNMLIFHCNQNEGNFENGCVALLHELYPEVNQTTLRKHAHEVIDFDLNVVSSTDSSEDLDPLTLSLDIPPEEIKFFLFVEIHLRKILYTFLFRLL
jgi:hypothetical protein